MCWSIRDNGLDDLTRALIHKVPGSLSRVEIGKDGYVNIRAGGPHTRAYQSAKFLAAF